MKTFLSLACLLLICSCEINNYEAHSGVGNWVKETNVQMMGTRSNSRSDGSSYANDYQKSGQDVMQFLGVLATGYFTAVGQANQQAANAYYDANGVIRDANGNIAGYLKGVVPSGGLEKGMTVPAINQLSPAKLPKFKFQ